MPAFQKFQAATLFLKFINILSLERFYEKMPYGSFGVNKNSYIVVAKYDLCLNLKSQMILLNHFENSHKIKQQTLGK